MAGLNEFRVTSQDARIIVALSENTLSMSLSLCTA